MLSLSKEIATGSLVRGHIWVDRAVEAPRLRFRAFQWPHESDVDGIEDSLLQANGTFCRASVQTRLKINPARCLPVSIQGKLLTQRTQRVIMKQSFDNRRPTHN
jgi:hypothetical protein